MFKIVLTATAIALLAASVLPAAAAPVRDPLALTKAAPQLTDQVRWRGGGGWGWRGGGWRGGWGWGPAAGFATGALIGGALARPYYGYPYGYGYGYGYPAYYGYGYPPQAYAAPGYGGDAVAYCMRRYRSYDPRTGTFSATTATAIRVRNRMIPKSCQTLNSSWPGIRVRPLAGPNVNLTRPSTSFLCRQRPAAAA